VIQTLGSSDSQSTFSDDKDSAGAGVGRPRGFSERSGNVCSPNLARFGRIDRSIREVSSRLAVRYTLVILVL
jgi:hypothetical protein